MCALGVRKPRVPGVVEGGAPVKLDVPFKRWVCGVWAWPAHRARALLPCSPGLLCPQVNTGGCTEKLELLLVPFQSSPEQRLSLAPHVGRGISMSLLPAPACKARVQL